MYISDDLAQEIYDRLVRAVSEEEVNRNRAREQCNVPQSATTKSSSCASSARCKRSLSKWKSRKYRQLLTTRAPRSYSARRVLRTPLLKGALPPSGPF